MLCMLMSMVDTPEDKRKVEKLYEQYNRLMFVVAYKILNNKEDAEDVVLESWEKIIRNLAKINKIKCQETKSFIVIIVERTALNLYQRNKKRVERVISVDEYEGAFMSTKDKELDNVELYEVMRKLSNTYSQVLILHYINGLSGREIAELFGVKETAIDKRLSRARKRLREELNIGE